MISTDIIQDVWMKNDMNCTNIEYININGLFAKYDVKIPFEKQVNIYIGENGLGKTTILNCIYYILSGKIENLASVKFESVDVKLQHIQTPYSFSNMDLQEYISDKLIPPYKTFLFEREISSILHNYKNINDLFVDDEAIIENISQKLRLPSNIIKSFIEKYYDEKVLSRGKKKGNKNKVVNLMSAIKKNIDSRILYLPTYRRIENDLSYLNIKASDSDKSEFLIRFGMSDVQASIDNILNKIRNIAMNEFTEMTGKLLKDYIDGSSYTSNVSKQNINTNTIKIVLDRIGDKIELSYKEKILALINNNELFNDKNFYISNLLARLTDNYNKQKEYDEKILKFVETCNKYLNNKHFSYNPSSLKLDIYLDDIGSPSSQILPLKDLSSGEKQIVSLFSKLYLEEQDNSILIIDEPELSLSILWQQMLLPDIIRSGSCKLLLTVTHSPFIFDNEFDYDAQDIRKLISMHFQEGI